jgi:cob(I)alamin adenosyltransferase
LIVSRPRELKKIFMSILNQIAEYLYLKKKDPNAKNTQWMKYMHGINRLSILLFLVAMIVIVVRLFIKK